MNAEVIKPTPAWVHGSGDSGLTYSATGKPVTDWGAIRQYVIDRDGGICQLCRVAQATDADHIWPRRYGGRDHITNLQAACGPCNKSKSAWVNVSRASTGELQVGMGVVCERIDAEIADLQRFIGEIALRHKITQISSAILAVNALRLELARMILNLQVQEAAFKALDERPDADVAQLPQRGESA